MRGCGTASWLLLCLTSAAADRIARTSDNGFHAAFSLCANFTMVNRAAAQFVYDGVARLNSRDVHGDILEAGVWKGGMSMLMALAEIEFGNARSRPRSMWLFDTFEGLPEPGPEDDPKAKRIYRKIAASAAPAATPATRPPLRRASGSC